MRSNQGPPEDTRHGGIRRRSWQKCTIRVAISSVHPLLFLQRRVGIMTVRLLGFRTRACGCVIGRYRELATSRELTYIEEKGSACEMYGHRRNHTIATDRAAVAPEPLSIRAS